MTQMRRFTWDEYDTIRELYSNGVTAREIGERLGRTRRSVTQVIYRYQKWGLVPHKRNKEKS